MPQRQTVVPDPAWLSPPSVAAAPMLYPWIGPVLGSGAFFWEWVWVFSERAGQAGFPASTANRRCSMPRSTIRPLASTPAQALRLRGRQTGAGSKKYLPCRFYLAAQRARKAGAAHGLLRKARKAGDGCSGPAADKEEQP